MNKREVRVHNSGRPAPSCEMRAFLSNSNREVKLKVKRTDMRLGYSHFRPSTRGSAGIDLRACTHSAQILRPGDVETVSAGFCMEPPHGYAGHIYPRSGLGRKGLVLANTVGLIDNDYRGEIFLSLLNRSTEDIIILPMDRVAQMVFLPITHFSAEIVDCLPETARGTGGFGSTGA